MFIADPVECQGCNPDSITSELQRLSLERISFVFQKLIVIVNRVYSIPYMFHCKQYSANDIHSTTTLNSTESFSDSVCLLRHSTYLVCWELVILYCPEAFFPHPLFQLITLDLNRYHLCYFITLCESLLNPVTGYFYQQRTLQAFIEDYVSKFVYFLYAIQ